MNSEKLLNVKTVICHDSCPDGTASAIILRDALLVDIRFVQYGTAAFDALKPEPGMLFCDFSPPAHLAPAFVEAGAIVLDHHRTARPIVEMFGENGIFGDEQTEPGVCGAVLAYRHVWKPLRASMRSVPVCTFIENLATLAGIRDTWQRQSPLWTNACVQSSILAFFPNSHWLQKTPYTMQRDWSEVYLPIGELLVEKGNKNVARSISAGYRFTSAKGTRVICFDGLKTSSDASEALGNEVDLVVGFMPTCEESPKYIFTTRSHTTFDCSAFAKAHGGGGHLRAAGFNVPIDPETALNPYAFLRTLLDRYEATR